MRFISAIILVVCCSFSPARPQGNIDKISRAEPAAGAVAQKPTAEDIQALRSDLQRMKSLVQQMENNLAFVDTTQSPLKHQFQLEIDMWKTVIQQMERRLDHARSH
jgi:hypothetical protein